MRVLSRIVAFVLMGFLLSLSVLPAQDKDKDKKDKSTEKWYPAGAVTGKILTVVEAKKSLRIELTFGKKKVPVEWQSTDDVKVRFGNERLLPQKFDDKGNISRYTRKELKELKGDDKKSPGYPAEFSDLKAGQYAQVKLVKKKPPRQRGKNVEPDVTGEYKPHISLIVILTNPN